MKKLILAFLLIPTLCFAGQWGTTRVNNLTADTWVRIYNTTVAANTTEVVIPGLNGDVDERYLLRVNAICAVASGTYMLRVNNDSAANYHHQYLLGDGSSVEAGQDAITNGFFLANPDKVNSSCAMEAELYAKSGATRTLISSASRQMNGTYVGYVFTNGQVWNDTATNIVNITFASSTAGAIGINTTVDLYKRGAKQ